ncbi:hypothetical protein [Nocardioides sp. WS12]|uniref:hypothetical protein n=1 Tax=Nocardioides sp. WS12 TaxID=2486272 RepID=UPI0015F8EAF3|nr:hypothetical protein [Nocardioides sp. WS12]
MTTTLHIENTVHDFVAWKEVFDKFDRFRAEQGVRSYRVTRRADDAHEVMIDLDFDSPDEAGAFSVALQKVWATPQSQQHLVRHTPPTMHELIEHRAF